MQEQKIIQLSDREHVLLRPNMYIGSIQPIDTYGFLLNSTTSKFEYSKYSYISGLIKIIMEILDNSLDENIRTNGKFANKIEVNISPTVVKISDNGRGVPTSLVDKTKMSQLELAFTHAKSGSNFVDEGRETVGLNGVGSYCSNVWSKTFKVISQTSTQKGILSCEDNMLKKSCEIIDTPSNKTGTIVEFTPDFKRFNVENLDTLHINLVYQRLIHLAVAYPNIQFKFNDKALKFQDMEKYFDSFSDCYCWTPDNPKYAIAVMPNDSDDFRHLSHINGLNITGGNHIDVITNEIISRLRTNKTFKKYPITPGDIRNKIQLVVIMRNFPKMEFDSQSKEKLTNAQSTIKQYFNDMDWDDFANSIAKNEQITDPILMSYKLKEELKNRLALKNMEKTDTREVRCEKYMPSIGEHKYLAIVEGDSAAGSLSSGLGRTNIGYFAARGVPLNAYTAKVSKFTANEELTNIVKVLGISLKKDAKQELTYQNIVLATDADLDGNRISLLFIGFFQKYVPSLLKENRIKKLRTPIITFNNSKNEVVKFFFKLSEYTEFIKTNEVPRGCVTKYYKGLGSWTKEKLKKLIEKYGLEYFIENIEVDEISDKLVDDWLGDTSENCESRKEYLRDFEVNIELA